MISLISWNVNGIRACIKKGFMDFFEDIRTDIFCIQETKLQKEQINIEIDKYYQYWNYAEKKGYSGTAVFSKIEPNFVSYGIGIKEHDQEGRLITLEYKDFYLVNVYTPNSQRELKRLEYRMDWENSFLKYVNFLKKKKTVIICGDLNVAHKEIDLKNPKSNRKNAGFTDEERDKISKLLDSGFIDTYRYFYPEKEGMYTWWSYMGNARKNNSGWRIDYFLVSREGESILDSVGIYTDILGSDHCPVGLNIRI